ncbi:MAG: glycosyltransferase [Candidatus Omnitrophota bacterium]
MNNAAGVSIILPVVNEHGLIRSGLDHFLSAGAKEVVVVDGGSEDGTFEITRNEYPAVRLFRVSQPNRALQMNLGASQATGDIFLFAHADMRLPSDAVALVQERMEREFVGGGFMKRYVPSSFLLGVHCFFLNVLFFSGVRLMAGTNALFVKKEVFRKVGGFPAEPFLEDILFIDRLKKEGRLAAIPKSVDVSPRRYLEKGVLKQILRNGGILLRHHMLRQDPSRLKEIYER